MKSTEKHTIWFGKPEGSEMKISMENYTPELRDQIISDYEEKGWMVLYQETTKKRFWSFLRQQYFAGVITGILLTWVIRLIFSTTQ